MKVINIAQRKGGTGKTTFATHIAAGLAIMGHKVGLIDTDSQGHCALHFDLEPSNALYALLVEGVSIADVGILVEPERYTVHDRPVQGDGLLAFIPSDDRTYQIMPEISSDPDAPFRFLNLVEDFGTMLDLDYIIVDTQPSISPLDTLIYLATDAFLYPTEVHEASIMKIGQSIKQAQNFAKQRKRVLGMDTRVIGILPNMMQINHVIHQENLSLLARDYGMFKDGGLVMSPVRLLTTWQQASSFRMPVYKYEPTGAAAREAWNVVGNVIERVEAWATSETS
jgi:chromosome partitioning protein